MGAQNEHILPKMGAIPAARWRPIRAASCKVVEPGVNKSSKLSASLAQTKGLSFRPNGQIKASFVAGLEKCVPTSLMNPLILRCPAESVRHEVGRVPCRSHFGQQAVDSDTAAVFNTAAMCSNSFRARSRCVSDPPQQEGDGVSITMD